MRLLEAAPDGGKDSGVTGYFLIECKWLFSIVLLHFSKGSREAFHEHAFNAITVWLRGSVRETILVDPTYRSTKARLWHAVSVKYTPRNCFHKIEGLADAWAISFRGPWLDHWRESRLGKLITLTHGRKVVNG